MEKYYELGVLDIILDPNFKNYSLEKALIIKKYLKTIQKEV